MSTAEWNGWLWLLASSGEPESGTDQAGCIASHVVQVSTTSWQSNCVRPLPPVPLLIIDSYDGCNGNRQWHTHVRLAAMINRHANHFTILDTDFFFSSSSPFFSSCLGLFFTWTWIQRCSRQIHHRPRHRSKSALMAEAEWNGIEGNGTE